MVDFTRPHDPFTEHEETPQEAVTKATIKQRAGIWALGFIAVITIVLGIVQLRKQITTPLLVQYDANSNERVLTLEEEETKKLQELKTKDSDGDGLSDYDELYVYDTSPYLADSDSDKASDKEELESGNNPNCPVGTECGETRTATKTIGENSNSAGTTTGTTQAQPGTAPDIAVIRETLKNAGAPAEIVDTMSDEELTALYNETTKQTGYQLNATGELVATGTATTTNTSTNSSTPAEVVFEDLLAGQTEQGTQTNSGSSSTGTQTLTPEMIETLKNLNPDEIRQLLIEMGSDEALVKSLDDETLKAIFLQAIEEQLVATQGTSGNTNTQSSTNTANSNTNKQNTTNAANSNTNK